jgi:hypothetical protein
MLPDGRMATVAGEKVRKFVILRGEPALVLAGTSSLSKWLDFSIYDSIRRYVEDFPESSFDEAARIVGPTCYEARAAFRLFSGARRPMQAASWAGKMRRFFARSKFFDGTDGNFLNLLGFDRGQMRVRNRTFSCTDRCVEHEQEYGATISGDLDSEEAWIFAGKLLELVGSGHPQAVVEALLSIAAEIAASHPETIGPPYYFRMVTKGASRGGKIYEEQFRRALAASTAPAGDAQAARHTGLPN